MNIFTVLGVVWVVLMGVRLFSLVRECRVFAHCFRLNKYTKTQARWVTFTKVFMPSLLAAPALLFLDPGGFLRAPSPEQIFEVARDIDAILRERSTANQE